MKKYYQIIGLLLLTLVSCQPKKEFQTNDFLAKAIAHNMLNEQESTAVQISLDGVPLNNLRINCYISKKINLSSLVKLYNLDSVNLDSNFNYLKYIREQLSNRSRPNPKGNIYLNDNEKVRQNAILFLKEIYDLGYLSSNQYAKILEQTKKEPVIFPCIIFEWIETMP